MNVNLNLLPTFVAVAEGGSFRLAAETIGRTQSAVSMQIQQLEAQLGRRLFSRTTRRVALTPEGEQLLGKVRAALEDLSDGLRQASGLVASHRGRVSVACAPSLAGSRLPGVIAAFQKAHPAVSLRLRELPLAGITESVRRQESDFGVGPPPLSPAGLLFQPLLTDPVCVLFRTGLLRGQRSVRLAAVADQPIVLMGGLRPMMEEAARRSGLALPVRHEAQQILTVLGLVRDGLGVGIVPGIAVPDPLEEGLSALPLGGPGLHREIGIITRAERPLPPVATALVALLRRCLSPAAAARPRPGPRRPA
ncbi:LysR family transcriptional regulator [Muricoccus nepalensis]|nr:LysR family transcriptional regulator [Roseomonas nepalensis]